MYFTCHAALVALLGLLFGMWHVACGMWKNFSSSVTCLAASFEFWLPTTEH
jgi:hypothetical protein